jgi:nucleotide-binding universal stress UspA family protein
MGESILVPLDGSPKAGKAFDYAIKFPDAKITVITVINPFDIDPLKPGFQSPVGKAGMPAYSQEWYQKVWDNATDLHDQMREKAEEQDVPFESVVTMGTAAKEIVKYAKENDIDHIIMGTHGSEDIANVFFGSVAEKVTRRAPMSVTIIR